MEFQITKKTIKIIFRNSIQMYVYITILSHFRSPSSCVTSKSKNQSTTLLSSTSPTNGKIPKIKHKKVPLKKPAPNCKSKHYSISHSWIKSLLILTVFYIYNPLCPKLRVYSPFVGYNQCIKSYNIKPFTFLITDYVDIRGDFFWLTTHFEVHLYQKVDYILIIHLPKMNTILWMDRILIES